MWLRMNTTTGNIECSIGSPVAFTSVGSAAVISEIDINTRGADDTLHIGDGTFRASLIAEPMNVNMGRVDINDTLLIDDANNPGSEDVFLLRDDIFFLGAGTTITYAETTSVQLATGSGADNFVVAQPANALNISLDGNAGSDAVLVGTTSGPDNVELSVADGSGVPEVLWNDRNVVNYADIENVTINANGGDDVISVLEPAPGVLATLQGGDGNDRIIGSSAAETMFGDAGRDTLKGRGGPDRLNGGPNRDRCIGGAGRDRFSSCEFKRQ